MSVRTITIAAYRRPDYLKQVLESLDVAMLHCPEYQAGVILGIDPCGQSDPKETGECVKIAERLQDWQHGRAILWPRHLGVDEHPRRLIQYAFQELDSDFNLHLEDDTVLSPDALNLALWYSKTPTFSEILSLYHPSTDDSRPDTVERIPGFSCWGWACQAAIWKDYLALNWNCKRSFPIGWDWSVTETMNKYGLRAVAPVLSRVKNIGRERGEYQTPEQHDKDFGGQVQAGLQHIQTTFRFKK